MSFFQKLFGKKEEKPKEKDFTPEEMEQYDELKAAGLEKVLGKAHGVVGHAIVPFYIGGAVDMYYYPNGIKGTGFATMELINPDGTGPIPNQDGTYELIAFTKHDYADGVEEKTPFNLIERRMCGVFTTLGDYSMRAKLQPGDTCEVPAGEGEPNICLVFDEYKPDGKEFHIGSNKHGLLLVIEIFRDEMEFAMENGSVKLLEMLKENGYYPYSDLDRKSILE